MNGRSKPLHRWWPLAAAGGLALAVVAGRNLFTRIQGPLSGPVRGLAAPLARSLRHAAAPREGEADLLRRRVLLLSIENATLREALARARARAQDPHLVFPDQRLAKLLPCAVEFRDPAAWFKEFTVDVGADDQVRPDAGVLDAYGVVGRLDKVGGASSSVALLSDPSCRLSARLARTGLECVVAGDGRGGCLLEHLGGQDDVRVGDLVETGAGSLSFPPGVPVGKVLRLERLDEGLRLRVEVQPSAPLDRLDGLYVWVGEPRP